MRSYDPQRWAPLVVDIAPEPFEPRPPAPRPYRPDTMCDGWSTADLHVRLASVRGYAHRYEGTSRQDAAEVRAHPPTGAVVFAVADGVSSARWSDEGANRACHHALGQILTALDRDPGRVDWAAILGGVAAGMCRDFGRDPKAVADRYATTLVTGVAWPGRDGLRATMVQVGDSAAWVLRDRRYTALLEHKMTRASAVTDSAVAPLPYPPERVKPVDVDLSPGDVLLVGTDGIGDPLGDGTGLVGALIADVFSEVPSPLGLAHALDFARETFDDDRTLVAIWPTTGGQGR
jgi:hypothetical protein